MPDPWLTKDGKVHPAAEPLPEWEGRAGEPLRLFYEKRCGWTVEGGSTNDYYFITAHEAAALLEKAAREENWRQNLEVQPLLINEDYTDFVVHNFVTDKYLTDLDEWSDDVHAAQEFPDYTAALQAGVLAAKGDDDEQDAE